MSRPRPKRPPIVRTLMSQPHVDPETAFAFLGVRRDLGYRLMAVYRARMAKLIKGGRPLDAAAIAPLRARDGVSFAEIPNYKVGGRVRCRSDLLLDMVFPEEVRP